MKSSFLLFNLFLINALFNQAFAYEIKGKKISIGNGYAYTSVKVNRDREPLSFGIVLTKAALDGLPKMDQTYTLKLPKMGHVEPYNEIQINWNAMGHEPPGVYDIPHFDFHFYTISKAERESIMCTGSDISKCTKLPPSDYIAPFYIPTPAGVPMMGWHWLDSRSPELNGKRFTSTFIYGYYDGEIIFVEPMITREFLLANGSVDQELSIPKKYAIDGYYPTKYTLKYDAVKKLYRITMENLKLIDTNK